MNHFAQNAKAYAALVGSVLTALLGIYGPDTATGHWLTVGLAVVTAVGTWRLPNAPADIQGD